VTRALPCWGAAARSGCSISERGVSPSQMWVDLDGDLPMSRLLLSRKRGWKRLGRLEGRRNDRACALLPELCAMLEKLPVCSPPPHPPATPAAGHCAPPPTFGRAKRLLY
jgi:hypothetical protein